MRYEVEWITAQGALRVSVDASVNPVDTCVSVDTVVDASGRHLDMAEFMAAERISLYEAIREADRRRCTWRHGCPVPRAARTGMPAPWTGLTTGGWAGRRAVVIGGGESVRTVQPETWAALERARRAGRVGVIGCNRAYLLESKGLRLDVVISHDQAFWKRAREDVAFLRATRLSGWAVPALHVALPADPMPEMATCYVRSAGERHDELAWGDRLEDGLGMGGHTGYSAINLASVLAPDSIILLGFDGTPGWWHAGWPEAVAPGTYERFSRALDHARARSAAPVWNANPANAYGIPGCNLDEALA